MIAGIHQLLAQALTEPDRLARSPCGLERRTVGSCPMLTERIFCRRALRALVRRSPPIRKGEVIELSLEILNDEAW